MIKAWKKNIRFIIRADYRIFARLKNQKFIQVT